MKKQTVFLLFFVAVCIIGGCNTNTNDPTSTLNAFFDAMAKKDIVAARKLTTADSKAMIDMMEKGLAMAKDSSETAKFDKKRMEIGEAKIEGTKATIPVKDKVSGESSKFILKKEEGIWKVAFDMGSVMEMAGDKMKEKGINGDSLSAIMEQLKSINLDSLAKSFNNDPSSIDSLKEALKNIKK